MKKFKKYINEEDKNDIRWKKYLSQNKMLQSAVKVMTKIEASKFKVWIVGGAVRDIIMGHKAKDIDLATNMPIEKIESIFKNVHDIGQSRDFGIVTIKQGSFDFEIAQLRKDATYKDGRRPESVDFNVSIDDDLSRRDLTINAMAINSKGDIIDKFNGLKDIKSKIIKTVGNPFDRFEEDYLRMLRAVRFSSKFGFKMSPDTIKAIKSKNYNIKKLSHERIRDELLKMASQTGDKFANSIIQLDDVGILDIILPELTKLKDFPEQQEFHPETAYVRKIIK